MIAFRREDRDQMFKVENELSRVLNAHAHNTEAALAVFALARCANQLLKLYPPSTREQLARVLTDFINQRETPRDDPAANLLILQ